MLQTSNFVHGSAMRSLSLVMSECSLSGRGQGHSCEQFLHCGLRKFRHPTATRRCTVDLQVLLTSSSAVGLWITHMSAERIVAECTSLLYTG